MRAVLILPTLFLIVPNVYAKPAFRTVSNCAVATVQEGDTCSNAKVKFVFENCGQPMEPKIVDRVACDRTSITARTTVDDMRFEAKFEKLDDGWGAVQWKPLGSVRTLKKQKSDHAVFIPPQPPSPSPALSPAADRGPAQAAEAVAKTIESLKVKAFFDFRFTDYKSDDLVQRSSDASGFLLEDGDIKLSLNHDRLSALVDIPFSRGRNSNTEDANISLGRTKSQFYVRYSVLEDLTFEFGQFDTFFGVEVNDSIDRVFGNTGLVYNQTLPIVHGGAFLEYTKNGFTGRIMAANASDRESLGNVDGDSYIEAAATIGYAQPTFRTQVGYLSRPKRDLNATMSNRSLTDIIVGTTLGDFDLDLEYTVVKDPAKNTLTADAADSEEDGNGMIALAAYRVTESLKVGLRYEKIEKDPAAAGNFNKASAWGVNAAYRFNEHLLGRAEYVDTRVIDNPAKTDHRFDLAGIVSF